jgi:hypothetical protein
MGQFVIPLLAQVMNLGLDSSQMHDPVEQDSARPVWYVAAPKASGLAKPAAPVQPAPAAKIPELKSISDLCRMREFQLVNQNTKILARSIDAASEADPVKQQAILNTIIIAKRSLEELELSWSRLSCSNYVIKIPGRLY